jgi:hypothetical protein
LRHNHLVRRFLAACLVALFATLATADTFACPDGCLCAASLAAAAHCDATGACVFCSAAAMIAAPPAAIVDVAATAVDFAPQAFTAPFFSLTPPDHPPRRS